MDFLQYVGSIGGVSGVLAVLMWVMVRYLVSQMREDRRFMEDRLTKIIEADQTTREKYTKVLSELITLIQRLNGRLK